MSAAHWVLDTGALMGFAHRVDAVGQILVDLADADGTAAVPSLCLVEAYSLLHHEEYEWLRLLRRNPAVQTVQLAVDAEHSDDCPAVGGLARHAGRLGAGHAAFVALANAAGVVTSRPDQIRAVLGDQWEIVEV